MSLVAEVAGRPVISGGVYGPEASGLCTLVIVAGTSGMLMLKKPAAGNSHA